jgi:hypothetical protein
VGRISFVVQRTLNFAIWGYALSGKLPPSRPGVPSLGSPGARGLGGSSSGGSIGAVGSRPGPSESARPPALLAIFLVANLLVPGGILGVLGFEGEPIGHAVGVFFGMFVAVVLLGFFRQSLNKRRASGRFADWRISSSGFAASTTTIAWTLGAINLFIVCYELSRGFTE